jgi:ubiquinone/menaquinone biosynthesis C-methylase UbiE
MNSAALSFPDAPDVVTSSEDYARRFSGNAGAWFLGVQEQATLEMLRPIPSASVLDVGGGHGQLAGPLVRHGYRVTVLGSAESCGQRIQHLLTHKEFSFRVGNILELPYSDRAFDVVISFRLLPHVIDWPRFLHELCRVAGRAVIIDYAEVRSINAIAPLLFQYKKRLEGNTRPFACFRERQLLDVFRTMGYARTERYPQFFFPMVFHRTLKSVQVSAWIEQVCRAAGLTRLFGSPVILKLVRKDE